jgi:uncharacterized membrane protein
VGRAVLPDGSDVGLLRTPKGEIGTFTVPDADVTQAYGINSQGQIVGTYHDTKGYHGFLRDKDGTFTLIDGPAATYTAARGINDSGQIVGVFTDSSGRHGFLRDKRGNITTIGVNPPGSTACETQLMGINNKSQIVGYASGGSLSTYVGFVRDTSGDVRWFKAPSATRPQGTQVYAVNAAAKIVGYFTDRTGSHGFTTD